MTSVLPILFFGGFAGFSLMFSLVYLSFVYNRYFHHSRVFCQTLENIANAGSRLDRAEKLCIVAPQHSVMRQLLLRIVRTTQSSSVETLPEERLSKLKEAVTQEKELLKKGARPSRSY
jgi:hypothetical protein